MALRHIPDGQTRQLILDAEREAQMVSALARLIITSIALFIFLASGGSRLPVAPVVLTYLSSYGIVSLASIVFSMRRFFMPWMSLIFTAVDGVSLALLIGFALRMTQTPATYHAAVPGFVFVFPILILATMRYTIGPVLVAFASFTLTWFLVAPILGAGQPGPADVGFFFGPVQNAARWGFVAIATLLALLAVTRRRRTLESAIAGARRTANLSRFLPDRVAAMVSEQGIASLSRGRQQEATVLFVDIRGFTAISETLDPVALGALLSEFRSRVAAEVEDHAGIVDKFIGDAVMAVFGVAEASPDHAARGARCALSLLRVIRDWNTDRQAAGLPPIRVTVGVHTGDVFAGTLGTAERMEFTVLGDTVNVAARLQEKAKSVDGGLVVSGATLAAAGPSVTGSGSWTALSDDSLRGRREKVSLYAFTTEVDAPQGGQ